LRRRLTKLGWLIGHNSEFVEFIVTTTPLNLTKSAELEELFSDMMISMYIIGDSFLSRYLRCSSQFAPIPNFHFISFFLFVVYIFLSIVYFLFWNHSSSILSFERRSAYDATCEWVKRVGLNSIRQVTAVRPIFENLSLSFTTFIKFVDIHTIDKHVFGVKPLSSYVDYDFDNSATLIKPVKICDSILLLKVSLREFTELYTDMFFVSEMTHLFIDELTTIIIFE